MEALWSRRGDSCDVLAALFFSSWGREGYGLSGLGAIVATYWDPAFAGMFL